MKKKGGLQACCIRCAVTYAYRLISRFDTMNYLGILIGAVSLLIIGIWHPIVVKGEYYLGKNKCIVIFAVIGIVCIAASLFIDNMFPSICLALNGFSALWGIKETFEQEKRVARGWFPSRHKSTADQNRNE